MKNEQNARILHDMCQINTFSPNFGGQFQALTLRVSGLDPNTNYVIMVDNGHRSTGAIVLNKQFMRLLMLLYSIT